MTVYAQATTIACARACGNSSGCTLSKSRLSYSSEGRHAAEWCRFLRVVCRRSICLRRRKCSLGYSRNIVGVDMLGIIWIRICSEPSSEYDCRSIRIDFSFCTPSIPQDICRILRAYVTDQRVQSGMDIFDIIFAHNLLVNQSSVLLLLGETRLKEQQLRRYQYLKDDCCEYCYAWSWV